MLAASALLLTTMILAAGCAAAAPPKGEGLASAVTIDHYRNVTVDLDYAHGTGVLPVDKYDNDSPENTVRILHAIAALSDKCMVKQGYSAISSTVDWKPFPAAEDRMLGRWAADYAGLYGAAPPPDSGPPQVNLVQFGVQFNKAYATCQDSAKQKLLAELQQVQMPNIVREIRGRAFELATSDPAGRAALVAWRTCSEDAGIVLDPGDHFPVEEYKQQGKEAEIKAYTTHAECARSSGAIQAIYDLRARYELALLDSQQEKLATFRKEQSTLMSRFDQVIENG